VRQRSTVADRFAWRAQRRAYSTTTRTGEAAMTLNQWGDRFVACVLLLAVGWLTGVWSVDYGNRMKQASYYAKCASDQDPIVNVRTGAVACRQRPAAAR
jgi:hypothetical protein